MINQFTYILVKRRDYQNGSCDKKRPLTRFTIYSNQWNHSEADVFGALWDIFQNEKMATTKFLVYWVEETNWSIVSESALRDHVLPGQRTFTKYQGKWYPSLVIASKYHRKLAMPCEKKHDFCLIFSSHPTIVSKRKTVHAE